MIHDITIQFQADEIEVIETDEDEHIIIAVEVDEKELIIINE